MGANVSVHTDTKNATRKSVIFFLAPRVRSFGLTRRVKNYPTNEIAAFAHVSGAAEVTVKHNLGALKHKTVLLSTRGVTVRKFSHYTRWGVTLPCKRCACLLLLKYQRQFCVKHCLNKIQISK